MIIIRYDSVPIITHPWSCYSGYHPLCSCNNSIHTSLDECFSLFSGWVSTCKETYERGQDLTNVLCCKSSAIVLLSTNVALISDCHMDWSHRNVSCVTLLAETRGLSYPIDTPPPPRGCLLVAVGQQCLVRVFSQSRLLIRRGCDVD